MLETHPAYRTFIGALGITLPFILVVAWLLLESKVETSISAYYYTRTRDWLVGTLCVIGIFLFFYSYRPRRPERARSPRQSVRTGSADSWLGKVAGLSAVVVALVPTNPPPLAKDVAPTIGTLHGAAAALLFLCLALFPLLLFSESQRRRSVYRGFGWTMIALLVLTAAYAFAPQGFKDSIATLTPLPPLLVLETLLIEVFGVSWFVKGRELATSGDQAR